MSGTRLGGLKTRDSNYRKYGRDFYVKTGSKGGRSTAQNGTIKGFAAMSDEKRREAGRKGGLMSRKTRNFKRNGMEAYLNGTRSSHNGLGYDDWMATITLATSIDEQSEIFNVKPATISSWRRQTMQELDKKRGWGKLRV